MKILFHSENITTLISMSMINVLTVKKFCDLFGVLTKALEGDSFLHQSSNSNYSMVDRSDRCWFIAPNTTVYVLSHSGICWMDNCCYSLWSNNPRNKKK